MADSPLIIKSKAFALDAISVCKELRAAKCECALISQYLRSYRLFIKHPPKIYGLSQQTA